jgi:uncharacterized protein (UPF0335 family)
MSFDVIRDMFFLITSELDDFKMLSLYELLQKIEELEQEKTQLLENIKELRREAEGKAIALECEIAVLKDEAETLRKMIKVLSQIWFYWFY